MHLYSHDTHSGCGSTVDLADALAVRPRLQWTSASCADLLGMVVRLDRDDVTIGRSTGCGLVLEDPGISRRHARLTRGADGAWTLTDLGSTNGTYLNGVRIHAAPLAEGDTIQLGAATAFRFTARVDDARDVRLAGPVEGSFEWSAATGDVLLAAGAERLVDERGAFWAAVHPCDRERLAKQLVDAAAAAAPFEVECRLAGPHGVRWYALRGEAFRGLDGAVTHLAGLVVDVTSRKLADVEQRRRAVLDAAEADPTVVDLAAIRTRRAARAGREICA